MSAGKVLQPGELTKPVRVWCSSSSIRIGWFQAEPVSEQITVFYKKTGSLFGTEIVLPTASLIGPDLSMSGPATSTGTRPEYFELDIRKLKPGTQYVVKVRATQSTTPLTNPIVIDPAIAQDATRIQPAAVEASTPLLANGTTTSANGQANGTMLTVPVIAPLQPATFVQRSERLSTLGLQEETKRNVDMSNFIGSLIKLGEYDGTIISFDAGTGLYEVRILQIDEAGSTPQLIRLASEYTDLGLPARTYTLSSIRFGRWGGEISNSQVVGEGELRWIVGRSVQLAERSEAASNFAVREGLMQAQNRQLAIQLDAQRDAAMTSLAITRKTYQVLFAVCILVCLLLVSWAWSTALRGKASAKQHITAAIAEADKLREELYRLELYRESLELDTGSWIGAVAAKAGSRQASWAADLTYDPAMWTQYGRQPMQGPKIGQNNVTGADHNSTHSEPGTANITEDSTGGSQGAEQQPNMQQPIHPLLDMTGPLLDALRNRPSHKPQAKGDGDDQASDTTMNSRDWWGSIESNDEQMIDETEPPKPWAFVHHAANLYALYLNEWIKRRMAQSIRVNIHSLLADQQSDSNVSHAASSGSLNETKEASQAAARASQTSQLYRLLQINRQGNSQEDSKADQRRRRRADKRTAGSDGKTEGLIKKYLGSAMPGSGRKRLPREGYDEQREYIKRWRHGRQSGQARRAVHPSADYDYYDYEIDEQYVLY